MIEYRSQPQVAHRQLSEPCRHDTCGRNCRPSRSPTEARRVQQCTSQPSAEKIQAGGANNPSSPLRNAASSFDRQRSMRETASVWSRQAAEDLESSPCLMIQRRRELQRKQRNEQHQVECEEQPHVGPHERPQPSQASGRRTPCRGRLRRAANRRSRRVLRAAFFHATCFHAACFHATSPMPSSSSSSACSRAVRA